MRGVVLAVVLFVLFMGCETFKTEDALGSMDRACNAVTVMEEEEAAKSDD